MSLRIYGNRLVRTPNGLDTRPTLGRVRTAVFGRWSSRLAGCRWLDLCAGAGTMGAEALARGAAEAFGIELAGATARIAQANWDKISPGRGHVQRGDVLLGLGHLARAGRQFDLVYFDPPYRSDFYPAVLSALPPLLTADAEIAAEHDKHHDLPAVAGLQLIDRRTYGTVAVSFYRLASGGLD